MFDVFPNGLFVNSHRGHEVSVGPESGSAPVRTTNVFELFLERTSAVDFENTHCLPHGHLGRNGDEEMDVVLIVVELVNDEFWIVLGDGLETHLHMRGGSVIENFAPILSYQHEMVPTVVHAVGLPREFHGRILLGAKDSGNSSSPGW